ncbi:MAG: suppressor of fused domain protein [Planctomycetes bacterium]|nr:suppressor of fused domain protein [Planctomycetota bacterium]
MPEEASHLDAITAHVEKHFGKVELVFHELISDELHIDVLIVAPRDERPCWTLVTSGMSEMPMNVPEGQTAPRRAELLMTLDPGWEMDQERWSDERHYWPIRQLKILARWPSRSGTFLAARHTTSDDPPKPYAEDTPFAALALLVPLDREARRLRAPNGEEIALYQVVPLHAEELADARAGEGDLEDVFDEEELRWIWNERPSLSSSAARSHFFRGQLYVRIATALLVTGFAIDLASCYADGVRLPFSRACFGGVLVFYVLDARRLARWISVGLVAIGAIAGVVVLLQQGFATWRLIGLAASLPLWIAALALLVLPRDVGIWFEGFRLARERDREGQRAES